MVRRRKYKRIVDVEEMMFEMFGFESDTCPGRHVGFEFSRGTSLEMLTLLLHESQIQDVQHIQADIA